MVSVIIDNHRITGLANHSYIDTYTHYTVLHPHWWYLYWISL